MRCSLRVLPILSVVIRAPASVVIDGSYMAIQTVFLWVVEATDWALVLLMQSCDGVWSRNTWSYDDYEYVKMENN